MLQDTTLRFCSSRDTERGCSRSGGSMARPGRLPFSTRSSSAASGLREHASALWMSGTWVCGAPLLEVCCGWVEEEGAKQKRVCVG